MPKQNQTVVLSVLALLTVASFSTVAEADQKAGEAPDWIVELAWEQMIERIGPDLTDEYVTFDKELSGFWEWMCKSDGPCAEWLKHPFYTVAFRYAADISGPDDVVLKRHFDLEGNPVGNPVFLPDCVTDSDQCVIRVGKVGAIAIAKEEVKKFDVTVYLWETPSLTLVREPRGRAAWVVKAMTSDPPAGCNSSGIGVTIDATNGEVLDSGRFTFIC